MQDNNTYSFYSSEDIIRYLRGSMTTQEMHDLEKAALMDPLLTDAIDGFRNANTLTSSQHLNEIKSKILGIEQHKISVISTTNNSKPANWWRWAAAACTLALLAGSAWWFLQQKENGLNIKQPVANITEQTEPSTTTTFFIDTNNNKTKKPAINEFQAKEESNKLPFSKTKKGITKLVNAQINVNSNEINKELAEEQKSAKPIAAPNHFIVNNETIATNATSQKELIMNKQVATAISLKETTPSKNNSLSNLKTNNPILFTKNEAHLPKYTGDSIQKAMLSLASYKQIASLPPRSNLIKKTKEEENSLNEVIIVGYNQAKKKTAKTAIGDFRKFQKETEAAWKNEVIYPEEGWAHFYEELNTGLGVDKSKTTKTLQIKFTVDDNGDPVDFEIVQSPDEIITQKAIQMIKKSKWKNFKLDKNAIVKIEVN